MDTNRVYRLSSVVLLVIRHRPAHCVFYDPLYQSSVITVCSGAATEFKFIIINNTWSTSKSCVLSHNTIYCCYQHLMISLLSFEVYWWKQKHFGTFSVVRVRLGPPAVAPSVLHFLPDFWLFHKHDLLDSKHHHVMKQCKSCRWVTIKAQVPWLHTGHSHYFQFSVGFEHGHLSSCFELEVNENKLASQPRAEKRTRVNTHASLSPCCIQTKCD